MNAVQDLERYCSARERQMHVGELSEPDLGIEKRVVQALESVDADLTAVRDITTAVIAQDLESIERMAGAPLAEKLREQGRERLNAVRTGDLATVVREACATLGTIGLVEAMRPLMYPEHTPSLRM